MHSLLSGRQRVPPTPRRRVLIVDDHDFFAACLRMALDNEEDLVVCDVTSDSEDLVERVRRLKPDLLVIDVTLGTKSGVELSRHLRSVQISTPILFTSTLTRPTRAELNGITRCAFIPKDRGPAVFLAALREVLARAEEQVTHSADPFALTKAVQKA